MQRLIEEQYIQPHQAQILPLMIMNFSFMIQQNNVSILTTVVIVSAMFEGYIPKTKLSTLICNKYMINEILLKGTKALQLRNSLIQP